MLHGRQDENKGDGLNSLRENREQKCEGASAVDIANNAPCKDLTTPVMKYLCPLVV